MFDLIVVMKAKIILCSILSFHFEAEFGSLYNVAHTSGIKYLKNHTCPILILEKRVVYLL